MTKLHETGRATLVQALRIAVIALVSVIAFGCSHLKVEQPVLTNGLYTMESDIRKVLSDQHNYGGTNACRITIHKGRIRIESQESDPTFFEGTVKGRQVEFSFQAKKRDPLMERYIERYHFVQLWKGTVISNDTVTGDMSSYTGTNLYMSGTWSLKKVENK